MADEKPDQTDGAILEEIRENFHTDYLEWDPVYEDVRDCLKVAAGDPWPATERQQREGASRPVLVFDEVSQYYNQVINGLRGNKRGIKFTARGSGATDKGARVYEDKAREIEYRSSAAIAYITAAENMVQGGVGWIRITTRYDSPRDMTQDLWIEPIFDPTCVFPDATSVWPDCRDMNRLTFIEQRRKRDYIREFGKDARPVNFGTQEVPLLQDWIKGDIIQVGEYWTKEKYQRPLVAWKNERGDVENLFEDEIKDTDRQRISDNMRLRNVESHKVMQYLTNGLEILNSTRWLGEHIPFISSFGKVIWVQNEGRKGGTGARRTILSMTSMARDPYLSLCYLACCELEMIGITPKIPYMAYKGQLDPDNLIALQKSLHEPVAVIEIEPIIDGSNQQVLPLPRREPYDPPIQSLEIAREAMRRAIQSSMGLSPLPTEAQRHNQKSGVALKQIESTGQRGAFHFEDHYNGMIQRCGVVIEDLLDRVHPNARDLEVIGPDETARKVRINDPSDPQSVSLRGSYLPTVSTGPSYESERQAADDFMDTLVSNLQIVASIAGPQTAAYLLSKSVRMKDLGPTGDQIADVLEPPAFKQASQEGGQPSAGDLQHQQQMAQAKQAMQQMQQQLQKLQFEKMTDQEKQRAQVQMKKWELEFQVWKAQQDSETKITVAELGAKIDRLSLFLEERERIGQHALAAHDLARQDAEAVASIQPEPQEPAEPAEAVQE